MANLNIEGYNRYHVIADDAADKYGVPRSVLSGVVSQESNWDPYAVSSAGAQGIAQFMPGTAQQYGVNSFDPNSALEGSAHYLKDLYGMFGNWGDAVTAYNAGPGNVQRGTLKPESQAYLPAVRGWADTYFGGFENSQKSMSDQLTTAPTSSNPKGGIGSDYVAGLLGNGSSAAAGGQDQSAAGNLLSNLFGTIGGLFGSTAPQAAAAAAAGQPAAGSKADTSSSWYPDLSSVNAFFAAAGQLFTLDFWKSAGIGIAMLLAVLVFVVFGGYALVRPTTRVVTNVLPKGA